MRDNSGLRSRYLEALALPIVQEGAVDPGARKAAIVRAHELRKFEIENYWKRATYFWAFQVAAFALLGLIWKETGASLQRSALLLPSALGAISALVGYLSALGSKFWQENWEAHVDMLEGAVEGRLTQTILFKKQQYSVSRANQDFTFLLTLGWVTVFAIVLFPGLEFRLAPHLSWLASIALLVVMCGVAWRSRMDLTGLVIGVQASDWERHDGQKKPKMRVLLRDAKGALAEKPARAPSRRAAAAPKASGKL